MWVGGLVLNNHRGVAQMSMPIQTEIEFLSKNIGMKLNRLSLRVVQLEADQLALSQVATVVGLIEAIQCGITYNLNPSHRVPTFTLPLASV